MELFNEPKGAHFIIQYIDISLALSGIESVNFP